jgi:hypothetical protein
MTGLATKQLPIHWLARAAFALSLVAVAFAFYGSLHAEKQIADSPLRQARGSAGLPAEPTRWWDRLLARGETSLFGDRIDRKVRALTARSKIANYSLQIIAFFLPFALGITAAYMGGHAMTAIERQHEKYVGNFQAVFSIMIGGFAAVISGCMIFSLYVWPAIPSLYTT